MGRRPYTINRLKSLNDSDRVIIVLYAYGMYVDDTYNGTDNGQPGGKRRGYITKQDIVKNVTNPTWLYSRVFKEEIQTVDGIDTLVLRCEM